LWGGWVKVKKNNTAIMGKKKRKGELTGLVIETT